MGKVIDLTGQRFGMLTVIERAPKPEGSHSTSAFWRCRCDCGNEKIISGNVLRAGKSKSCGCLNYKQRDLTSLVGKTFGKLTVLSRAERPTGVKSKDAYWHCKCECGTEIDVMGKSLKSGRTQSCGCLRHERNTKNLVGQKFGKLTVLEEAYVNKEGRVIWKCQCECGNYHYADGRNLQYGHTTSCGCIISKGEYKIAKILNENNIRFKQQYTFDDLLGKSGDKLRFDFGITDEQNNLLYLIEYNGIQHYEKSRFSSELQNEYDILKQEYCKEKNIPLIIIKYTQFNDLSINDLILSHEVQNEHSVI